jgi:hypothetical protein
MKHYDFKKAFQFIEERKENIQSALLGMHEDWFWTADSIFDNGEYTKELFLGDLESENCKYNEAAKNREANGEMIWDVMKRYAHILINGVNGSNWGTPTLNVVYKNGEDEMIPCYTTDGEELPFGEKIEKQIMWTSGCLSEPVQLNLPPLSQ